MITNVIDLKCQCGCKNNSGSVYCSRCGNKLQPLYIPDPLDKPDFNNLIKRLNTYLIGLTESSHDEDDVHYIYEDVMETVYGDKIFDFINKFT